MESEDTSTNQTAKAQKQKAQSQSAPTSQTQASTTAQTVQQQTQQPPQATQQTGQLAAQTQTKAGVQPQVPKIPLTGPQLRSVQAIKDGAQMEKFFEDEMTGLMASISYDGMDPKMIRSMTMSALGGSPTLLIRTIVIYIHWGSKFYNKNNKSKNQEEAAKVIASLKQAKIVENKQDGKLTLARIAAAHAPLVYCVRRMLKSKESLPITNIIIPGLGTEFQDLALACYSEIPVISEKMNMFLQEFAWKLYEHALDKKRTGIKTRDEVIKEMDKYRMAAVASLENDSVNRVILPDMTINTMLDQYGYNTI